MGPAGAVGGPGGRVPRADRVQPLDDTQLVERPRAAATLAAWLQPAGSAVDADIVATLLLGIGCTAVEAGTDETWVSPDGRFRVWALACAWGKPVAVYVGYAARAAARARRLAAIAS